MKFFLFLWRSWFILIFLLVGNAVFDLPNMILTWRFNKRGESPLLHASAKSNVGHEEANAGTCGFIKAPWSVGKMIFFW